MAKFEIVRMVADFDDRDRIVGWRGRRVAVSQTAEWAFKLLEREDQDHDVRCEVRDITTGKRVHREFPVAVDFPF